jgi:hypothetical protein
MQKVSHVLTKLVEVSLFLLERTWVGSVVEAIVGKAVVASALFASLRYLKKLQVEGALRQEAAGDQFKKNPISEFSSPRTRKTNPVTIGSKSPVSSPFD